MTLAHAERTLRAFPAKGYDVVRAQGTTLHTSDGRTLLDMGGASHGTALIGHNHPAVVEAIQDASTDVLHVAPTVPTPHRTAFLDALHRLLPGHLAQTFLANSGTEAVECALKLAMTATGRDGMVALDGGFHGRTMGSLSVTSREAFRAPFRGRLAATRFVRPGDVDDLHRAVSHDTAALVLEPILGEGGVVPLDEAFLRAARDITEDRGALLITDEVQTGFRTGSVLASQVDADIVTLGKGLAGGVPIGSCSVTDDVADALPPGGHGSTYGGAPIVAAAGRAVLDVMNDDRLVGRGATTGERFSQALANIDHPAIAGVRGRGMMLAVTLRMRATRLTQALEELGVLVLPAGPRAIRLLPPLTMTEQEMQQTVDAIGHALGPAP